MPQRDPALEQLVERSEIKAAANGHNIAIKSGDERTRVFECLRCGLGFTAGYDKDGKSALFAQTALTTPCPGRRVTQPT